MNRDPIEHAHTSSHEQFEIKSLANTVLSAFELAESIEAHAIVPGSHKIERTISSDALTEDLVRILLPPEVVDHIDPSRVAMDITYHFSSEEIRPYLELRLVTDDKASQTFATIQRAGGDSGSTQGFRGNFAPQSSDDPDYDFTISSESVSIIIQQLIKNDGLVINDEGVLLMDLLQELILDPQYPPMARYIYEVLAMRGMAVRDETNYPIDLDESKFIVRIAVEKGNTTEITVIEILQEDVEVHGDEIVHTLNAIGGRISRTSLSQAIQFFKLSAEADEVPIGGDSADLARLQERISFLKEKITQGQL